MRTLRFSRSVESFSKLKNRILAAIGVVLIFAGANAKAQSLPAPTMNIPEASSNRGFDYGLSLGLDYVTGAKCSLQGRTVSCTSPTTTAVAVPVGVMAQYDRLRLEVTAPFVHIEGPGTIAGVLGPSEILATTKGVGSRRSGLGDVSVGGALILLREGRIMPRVQMAGVVKLPTGRNGLGTGETDYGAQVSFYRPLIPGVTIFGSVGYQWIRDPNTVQFHTGGRATAGVDFNYGLLGGGALVDYRQSLFPGLPNSLTLDPYVTLRIIGGVGVQVYTSIPLRSSHMGRRIGARVVF